MPVTEFWAWEDEEEYRKKRAEERAKALRSVVPPAPVTPPAPRPPVQPGPYQKPAPLTQTTPMPAWLNTILSGIDPVRNAVVPGLGGAGIIGDVLSGRMSPTDVGQELSRRAGTGPSPSVGDVVTKELPALYRWAQERSQTMPAVQQGAQLWADAGTASRRYGSAPATGSFGLSWDFLTGRYSPDQIAGMAEQMGGMSPDDPLLKQTWDTLKGLYRLTQATESTMSPVARFVGNTLYDPLGMVLNSGIRANIPTAGLGAALGTVYNAMDAIDYASNITTATPEQAGGMLLQAAAMQGLMRGLGEVNNYQRARKLARADLDTLALDVMDQNGALAVATQAGRAGIETTPAQVMAALRGEQPAPDALMRLIRPVYEQVRTTAAAQQEWARNYKPFYGGQPSAEQHAALTAEMERTATALRDPNAKDRVGLAERLGDLAGRAMFHAQALTERVAGGARTMLAEQTGALNLRRPIGFSEEEMAAANRTCRDAGATAQNRPVPRVVSAMYGDRKDAIAVLDFGAGKNAKQAQELRDQGFDVTAHEFGGNVQAGIHDPDALSRTYDVVYASNVLNVQLDENMMRRTLEQLRRATKGTLIANYPAEPRKMGLSNQQFEALLGEYFENVRRVGGTSSAPIYAMEPKRSAIGALLAADPERQHVEQGLGRSAMPLTIRRPRGGVGKEIGGKLYVHRSSESVIPGIEQAKARLPEGTSYDVVAYDHKTGAITFTSSPDFDTAPEPTLGSQVRVSADGTVTPLRGRTTNPYIYHHKWVFVAPDYQGFDQAAAMRRSRGIEIYNQLHPGETKVYGNLDYWREHVDPWLEKHGFGSQQPSAMDRFMADETGALTIGSDRPLSEWSDADLSDEAARLTARMDNPATQGAEWDEAFARQGEISAEMDRRAAQPQAQAPVEAKPVEPVTQPNAWERLLAIKRELAQLERDYGISGKQPPTREVRAERDRMIERMNALRAEMATIEPEALRIGQEEIDREKAAREQRDTQEQQRRAQAVNRLDPSETSPYALAADYKARGMNRTRAWDQFIIDRALKPEITSAEFYRAYDSVEAKLLPTTRGEREGYAPAPQPAPARPAPAAEESSFVRRPPGIQTNPDLAEATRWAEEHRYTSGKTIKSRVDELLAAGGVVTDKGASITIKPPTGKGQTFTDVVALNYIRALEQAKPPAKQAWEMTPLEWARQELNNPNIVAAGSYGAQHRVEVRGALERGDPVPANVLALYPDLAEQFARPAQPAAPEPVLRPQAAAAPKPVEQQATFVTGEAARPVAPRITTEPDRGPFMTERQAAPEDVARMRAEDERARQEAAGQQRLGETAKQPWEMTSVEWARQRFNRQDIDLAPSIYLQHQGEVRRALERGDPVPDLVLAEHPDLAKEFGRPVDPALLRKVRRPTERELYGGLTKKQHDQQMSSALEHSRRYQGLLEDIRNGRPVSAEDRHDFGLPDTAEEANSWPYKEDGPLPTDEHMAKIRARYGDAPLEDVEQSAPVRPAPAAEEPSFVRRPPGIQTNPDLAEATRWAEEHRYTSGKTIKSRVDELLAAGGVVTDKGASITIKPPTGKGQTFTDVVALNYIRALEQAKPPAKQAWEMTPLEWARQELNNPNIVAAGSYGAQHRVEVRGALERGDPVPTNVLALYPDLAEQFARPAQPAAPEPVLRPQAETGTTEALADQADDVVSRYVTKDYGYLVYKEELRASGEHRATKPMPSIEELPPNLVYRVMNEDEWAHIERGGNSGEFWSSNPTEYGLSALDSVRVPSVLVVAKIGETGHKVYGGPVATPEDAARTHYHNPERKTLADVVAVYRKDGARLARIWPETAPAPLLRPQAATAPTGTEQQATFVTGEAARPVAPRITTEPDRGPFMTERQAAPEDVARMRAEDERARQEAAGQQRLGETPAEPAPAEPVEPAAPRYTDTPEGQEYQRRFDRTMEVAGDAYREAGAKWEGGTAEDDEAALAYWRRKSGAVNELAMLMDGEDRDLLRKSVSRKRLGGGEATRESVFGEERMVSRGPASAADIERADSEAVRRLEEHYSETAKGFLLTLGYTEADLSGVTQWSQWRKLLQEIEQGRLAKQGSGGVAKIDAVDKERRARAIAQTNNLPPGVAYHLAKYAGDVRLAKADVQSAILERRMSDAPLDKQLIQEFEEAVLRLPDDYADTPRLAEEAAGRQYQGGTDMAPRYIEVERVPLPLGDAIVRAQAKAQAGQPARVTTSEGDSEIGRLVRFIHAAADRAAVPRDADGNVVLETDLGRVILGQERAKGLPKYSVQLEAPEAPAKPAAGGAGAEKPPEPPPTSERDAEFARWDAEQARDDAEAARREQEHVAWQAEQARLDAEIEASWGEKPTTEVSGLAERQAAYERAHERRMQPAEPLENVDPERVVEVLTRPAETEALTPEETEAVRQGAAEGKPIEQVVDEALHPEQGQAAQPATQPAQPQGQPAQPQVAPAQPAQPAPGVAPRPAQPAPGAGTPPPAQPAQPAPAAPQPAPGGRGPQQPPLVPPQAPPGQPAQAPLPPAQVDDLARVRLSQQATPQERRSLKEWWDWLRIQIENRNHPLWQLQKKTGIPVEWAAEMVPGGVARGESLTILHALPALRSVQDDLPAFLEYMEIRRMLQRRALEPDMLLPGDVQDPQHALDQWRAQFANDPAKMARIEQAAEDFADANTRIILDEAVAYGRLSQEQRDWLATNDRYYLPWFRQDMDPDLGPLGDWLNQRPPARVVAGGQASSSARVYQRMTKEGSVRNLKDMLEAWYGSAIHAQIEGGKNEAAGLLIQAITRDDPTQIQRVSPNAQGLPSRRAAPGNDFIAHRDNGELEYYEVPQHWARAARSMDKWSLGLFENIMRVFNAPKKAGATAFNAGWAITNLLQDAGSAFVYEGLVPGSKAWREAMHGALKKDAAWHRAAQARAFGGSVIDDVSLMAQARERGTGVAIPVRSLRDVLNIVPKLGQAGETFTRKAVFLKLEAEQARRATTGQPMSKYELGHRVMNSTLNFDRAGYAGRVANAIIPFTNAKIQSVSRLTRAIGEDPKTTLSRLSVFIVPTVLAFLWNKQHETEKELSDYDKWQNWNLIIGEGQENPDPRFPGQPGKKYPIHLTLRKPDVAKTLTALVEVGLEHIWGQGDRSIIEGVLQVAAKAAQESGPIDANLSAILSPPLGTALQVGINKDVFRGRDIVPQAEMNRAPEWRYGPEQTRIAVEVGKRTKVSPRVIEFVAEQFGAGAATDALWIASLGLDALVGPDETPGAARTQELTAEQRLAQTPVIKRFYSTRGGQTDRSTYDELNTLQVEQNRDLWETNPEARRLGKTFGTPGTSMTVEGVPIELSVQDRLRIMQESYNIKMEALSELVASPEYQAMSDTERLRAWDKEVDRVNAAVREYVMSESPYVADARAKAKMVPPGVQSQYEAYSDISEYRAVVLDPSGKGVRVVDLDAQQATRIQEAQSVISDIRGLYSDMYGKTLSKKKGAYLYYQLTGDLEGAMLALTTRVRANPEREVYWDSHPLLADYYPRKAVAEETPDATSPMQAYSNWMNLPVARTSETVAAG